MKVYGKWPKECYILEDGDVLQGAAFVHLHVRGGWVKVEGCTQFPGKCQLPPR